MRDTTKKAIFAAVGAPVVTVKWVGGRLGEARENVGDKATKLAERFGTEARKEYDVWAAQGEKIVTRLSEQPVVEDFASRVDLDQLQGQMHRIREQLDDMLEAWRESFRPQKETVEVTAGEESAPAKGPRKLEVKKVSTPTKKPAPEKSKADEQSDSEKPAPEKSKAGKPKAATRQTKAQSAAAQEIQEGEKAPKEAG